MFRHLFSKVASHETSVKSALECTNNVHVFDHLLKLAVQCIRIDIEAFRVKEYPKGGTSPSSCLISTLLCDPSDSTNEHQPYDDIWFDSATNDGNHVNKDNSLLSFNAYETTTIRIPHMPFSTKTEDVDVSCRISICERDRRKRTVPSPSYSNPEHPNHGVFSSSYYRLLDNLWKEEISVNEALSSIYDPALFHDMFAKSCGTFLIEVRFHQVNGPYLVDLSNARLPNLKTGIHISSFHSRIEDVFDESAWRNTNVVEGDCAIALSGKIQGGYSYQSTLTSRLLDDPMMLHAKLRFLMSNSWPTEAERPLNEEERLKQEEDLREFEEVERYFTNKAEDKN